MTVSLPPALSFGEDAGTVEVCATLSITPDANTANAVTIMLATAPSKHKEIMPTLIHLLTIQFQLLLAMIMKQHL